MPTRTASCRLLAWPVSTHHDRRWLVVSFDHGSPGLDNLVGIGRAKGDQAGNRAECRELFNRLMGRAVLADTDRVMREHVDDRQLHQGAQANRRLHVIAEDQEP